MDEQRHHSGQRFPVPNDDDPWTCSARQDVTVPTDHPGWRRPGPALAHCKVVPSLDEGLEALKLRNNLGSYGQVHIVAVVCLSLIGPSPRSGPAEGAIIQHFSDIRMLHATRICKVPTTKILFGCPESGVRFLFGSRRPLRTTRCCPSAGWS